MSDELQNQEQTTPTVNVQQYQQAQANKVNNALKTGLALFDEDINVPIKLNDGLADLKWLLRSLLAGQFSINMTANVPIVKPGGESINGADK